MYVTYTRIYGWSDYGGESSYQPGYRLENMMWMTLLVYDYIIPGEKIDYERHLSYRQKHEILFCELPETEFWKLSTVDEYAAESYFLTDEQFDVKIKNELLAKAIETLTERKKEVIFLSYFQGMSDAAIARKLNLVRSTVCEHRTRSLELLKNTMEEYGYENYR